MTYRREHFFIKKGDLNMLGVVFINTENTEKIEKYRRYEFAEAVALTENVEKECRKEKQRFKAEFHLTSEDGNLYYSGVFHFGSYDYQNIYHQVRDKSPNLQASKDREQHRTFVLEQIEVLTPAAYKEIEEIDKTFINLEKTNISKLNKWQRITLYTTAIVGILGCTTLFIYHLLEKERFEAQLANEIEKASIHVSLIEQYEIALQGNRSNLIPYLEELQVVNKLNENQIVLLINEYLINDQFEKAVELNNDIIYLETLILANRLLKDEEKVKKISAFNDFYPTNEARFDLAYFEGNYELMLNIENVNMTVQRSEMKTYAYLKLNQLENAKRELNNNSNKTLEEKIVRYEILAAEIKTLEDRKKLVAEQEAAELQQQINTKRNEINAL